MKANCTLAQDAGTYDDAGVALGRNWRLDHRGVTQDITTFDLMPSSSVSMSVSITRVSTPKPSQSSDSHISIRLCALHLSSITSAAAYLVAAAGHHCATRPQNDWHSFGNDFHLQVPCRKVGSWRDRCLRRESKGGKARLRGTLCSLCPILFDLVCFVVESRLNRLQSSTFLDPCD